MLGMTLMYALPRLYATAPPIQLSSPVSTEPIPHLINRESVVFNDLAILIARSRNRLRLLALTPSSLVQAESGIIRNQRQQIIRHRPRGVVLGMQLPVQLGIPSRAVSDNPQVSPVQFRGRCVTETHPQPDQVKLESLPVLINELAEA